MVEPHCGGGADEDAAEDVADEKEEDGKGGGSTPIGLAPPPFPPAPEDTEDDVGETRKGGANAVADGAWRAPPPPPPFVFGASVPRTNSRRGLLPVTGFGGFEPPGGTSKEP